MCLFIQPMLALGVADSRAPHTSLEALARSAFSESAIQRQLDAAYRRSRAPAAVDANDLASDIA